MMVMETDIQDKYWLYSYFTNEYEEISTEEYEAITQGKQTIALGFYPDKIYYWCPRHKKYEGMQELADEFSSSGCAIDKRRIFCERMPKVYGTKWHEGDATLFWSIRLLDGAKCFEISKTKVAFSSEEKFVWQRLKRVHVPRIKFQQYKHVVDLVELQRIAKRGGRLPDIYPEKHYLPGKIFDYLSQLVIAGMSQIIGQAICFPAEARLNCKNDLWKIIEYPYNIHIGFLRGFLGDNKSTHDFYKDSCQDVFPAICNYLGIAPLKSIKKCYYRNPYAIIMYYWVLQLGFTDINAVRLFMTQELLNSGQLESAEYDYYTERLMSMYLPGKESLQLVGKKRGICIVFFVKWMLENGKSQMVLARQLVKLLSEGWHRIYDDTIVMFHQYYPVLSPVVKAGVLRRGICMYSHDLLMKESYTLDNAKQKFLLKIKYPEMVQQLNDDIDGIKFKVVDELLYLPKIGMNMSNCVASYADMVKNGECIIVVGIYQGKYQICIELRPSMNIKKYLELELKARERAKLQEKEFDVAEIQKKYGMELILRQILGKYNKHLTGELLEGGSKWVRKHRISAKDHVLGTVLL